MLADSSLEHSILLSFTGAMRVGILGKTRTDIGKKSWETLIDVQKQV